MKVFKMHFKMMMKAIQLFVVGCVILYIAWGVFYVQAMMAQRIVDNNQAKLESVLKND